MWLNDSEQALILNIAGVRSDWSLPFELRGPRGNLLQLGVLLVELPIVVRRKVRDFGGASAANLSSHMSAKVSSSATPLLLTLLELEFVFTRAAPLPTECTENNPIMFTFVVG